MPEMAKLNGCMEREEIVAATDHTIWDSFLGVLAIPKGAEVESFQLG
jgi:hypothetical protein